MHHAPTSTAAAPATKGLATWARPSRLPGWLAVLIAACVELIVGGYKIAGPSFWRDEASTISGSGRPVGAIFALVRHQDAVHGLYYVLIHPVIAIGGRSETVLRLPSLFAMCLAVALTTALGRRLAQASQLPAPAAVGLLAGLLLTAVPLATRYAQEARPYALTMLFALLATYCLVRATTPADLPGSTRSGRRWWVLYAASLTLTGYFNLFALLLAAGHGVSLLTARHRPIRPWLVACAAAAILVCPLIIVSAHQSAQESWLVKPTFGTLASSVRDFAGGAPLIPVVAALVVLGCGAGRGLRRRKGLTLAVVALPWLVLPPVVLASLSYLHPVYLERYVLFCLPALSLLVAAGLTWPVGPIRRAIARRGFAGPTATVLAVVPSVALVVAIVAGVLGRQADARLPGAKVDNLRAVASILARHEDAGDAIAYMPWSAAIAGMAYTAPFQRVRNIELGASPIASATVKGQPATAAVVAARLADVSRLWTLQWAQHPPGGGSPPPFSPTPAYGVLVRAVGKMRLSHQWTIATFVLSLYVPERGLKAS